MSTLKVNNLVTKELEDDLAFKTNNTTRMLLTSAGTLSGAGGSITNFTGVGKILQSLLLLIQFHLVLPALAILT